MVSALLVHGSRSFDAFSRILDDICPEEGGCEHSQRCDDIMPFPRELHVPSCLTVPLGAVSLSEVSDSTRLRTQLTL